MTSNEAHLRERSSPDPGAGGEDSEPGRLELGSQGFRAVFDAAPDGILIVDEGGVIRDVNPRLERMFGYRRAELVGRSVETLVPDSSRTIHERHRERYGSHPYARPMGEGLELQGQRYDGTLFPVEISLSPLHTDDEGYVVGTVRDVTERRRLRDFSVSTLRAAEDERLRLAQELHDDTAQQLSAILVRLRIARSSDESALREHRLDELREAIQECADGVRRIARGLRPPALQDVGVVAAIRSHAARLAESTQLKIRVDADRVEGTLGPAAALVLYRVVQEALSNVVRHSAASSVRVTVRRDAEAVTASVEDDGVGFDPTELERAPGLGTIGMTERAASVGGGVEVHSDIGIGTRVTVRIPFSGEESDSHG